MLGFMQAGSANERQLPSTCPPPAALHLTHIAQQCCLAHDRAYHSLLGLLHDTEAGLEHRIMSYKTATVAPHAPSMQPPRTGPPDKAEAPHHAATVRWSAHTASSSCMLALAVTMIACAVIAVS